MCLHGHFYAVHQGRRCTRCTQGRCPKACFARLSVYIIPHLVILSIGNIKILWFLLEFLKKESGHFELKIGCFLYKMTTFKIGYVINQGRKMHLLCIFDKNVSKKSTFAKKMKIKHNILWFRYAPA